MTNFGPQFLPEEALRAIPFRKLGGNVMIHARANFINVENLSIGDNVRIDPDVTILATGPVSIGTYVHIGAQAYLAGGAGIALGDFTALSQGVKIYSTSDDFSGRHLTNPTVPAEYLGVERAEVRLARHAIVGAGSVILPGVVVAEGCAVGALSLLRHSTEPWGIYFGTPAHRVAERRRDLLLLEAALLDGRLPTKPARPPN
jgi:galactoside O-acetyltransferase